MKRTVVVAAALLAACTSTLSAAPVGSIAGVVIDGGTRTPMAGANIIVADTDLGAAADVDGRFRITDVPTGIYAVEASMIGYTPQAKTSVVVEPNRSTDLVFKLDPSLIEMAVVTVKAEPFTKVRDAAVSERSFSSEEIQVQPGGSGDIQRVVQAMPAVVSSGDQDNEIIVRGGNPNENLFLLDGIEIPYPNHFGSFETQGGPISMLNPLLVREVDFVAGAFPARYGGRASSVMDIAVKRGALDELDVSIDMGMIGLGAIVEFPLPGAGNSFIGSYHKSFLELMTALGVWGMDAVPYYDNALAKASFKLSSAHSLSVLGMYGVDRINIAPGEDVADQDIWVDQQTTRYATGLSWQTLFGDRGFGKLLVSGSSTKWDQLVTRDSVLADTLQTWDATEQHWGARYDVSYRWTAGQETQTGVRYTLIPFNYDVYVDPDTVFTYRYDSSGVVVDSSPFLDSLGNVVVSSLDADSKASSYKLSGYLQHRLELGEFAHLTVGGRVDWFAYTGALDIAPRVGISTEPLLGGVSLHAGYGWHHQTPPYFVLLWDSTANHELASRRSDHYIVGLERKLGRDIKLSLEAYYKDNRRLPIPKVWTTPSPYDFSGTYVTEGNGTARGIELFLQKKYGRNWHGTLAYSFSDARIGNPLDETKELPGDFDYRHVFTVAAAHKVEFYKMSWYQNLPGWFKATIGGIVFSDEADFGFRFRYMGGRPYTPKEWVPVTRQWVDNSDLLNSARYPDYHRLDLRWDHKFVFNSWNLSWYLEVQNVYNRQNVWTYHYQNGDPEPQTVNQISFFPIGGLVVEF